MASSLNISRFVHVLIRQVACSVLLIVVVSSEAAWGQSQCGDQNFNPDTETCFYCGTTPGGTSRTWVLPRFCNGEEISWGCCDTGSDARPFNTDTCICFYCGTTAGNKSRTWLLPRNDFNGNLINYGCCGTGTSARPFTTATQTCTNGNITGDPVGGTCDCPDDGNGNGNGNGNGGDFSAYRAGDAEDYSSIIDVASSDSSRQAVLAVNAAAVAGLAGGILWKRRRI
jgi:hypothetical protein